ncbi:MULTISPECIES: lantibiotic dehydratase [Corallococcus]|nr:MULTISPECIES: lantibiotic dehydratase [Corallococcus]
MTANFGREPPHRASTDFFVLRTPLLPLHLFSEWASGVELSQLDASLPWAERIEAARRGLRSRLRELLKLPEVHEALLVSSPNLVSSLESWVRTPDGPSGSKVERALVRYLARMTGRATPFGLFAGCSVGQLGRETQLSLQGREAYQRQTRLDMDYLASLLDALQRQGAVRHHPRYFPNSSLYRTAGRFRYVESSQQGTERAYELAAVEATPYLEFVLERARQGARREELAQALAEREGDVSVTEAGEYVDELVTLQVLVSELVPAVTLPDPLREVIAQLGRSPSTAWQAGQLERVHGLLAELDAAGLGQPEARYRAVAACVEELLPPPELSKLVQVDLFKPVVEATLGREVMDELRSAVALLHRISPMRRNPLQKFKEDFLRRYEQQEVPLAEALDEDVGIGFEAASGPAASCSPLLKGLAFPGAPVDTVEWSRAGDLLLERVQQVVRAGGRVLELTDKDIEALSVPERLPLPDAFVVVATLGAASEEGLRQGDFSLLVRLVDGPSGVRLLGRFCHGDEALGSAVRHHLRLEEALRPDALFAEVVHVPAGRVSNVLTRPALRAYEIPYLGRSAVPPEAQIPLGDLLISVREGRLVLRSRKLGREIIPRMTTAHAHRYPHNLAIYRFLGALQTEGHACSLTWRWGALDGAPFLPRVVAGRVVLARARWLLRANVLEELAQGPAHEQVRRMLELRERLGLPRFVLLTDGDNELPVDLENALCVESFLALAARRRVVSLTEMWPAPGELCARGPEGSYLHELIIPFVGRESERKEAPPRPPSSLPAGRRSFPPGSEWLYARLHVGSGLTDRLLLENVAPVVRALMSSGSADQWHFLRYSDPEHHLRLRLRGPPDALLREALPRLHDALDPLLQEGRLKRFQLDTYVREVERYGGSEGVLLAEEFFHVDSEAVLATLEALEGRDGDARWQCALAGMDLLLSDFGFDLDGRHRIASRLRTAYAQEHGAGKRLEAQLSRLARQRRPILEPLLTGQGPPGGASSPGFAALLRRSERLVPVVSRLRELERSGGLSQGLDALAASYLHLHVNRMLRDAPRAHEFVLFDLLERLYASFRARGMRLEPAARMDKERLG